MTTHQPVHDAVQEYYGQLLRSTKDLKTTAASCCRRAPNSIIADIMSKIPPPVKEKFYGCGNPIPLGIQGKRVLDLGCGSGRDCYIAAALVGASGQVIGIDMTDEQLQVACDNLPAYTQALGYTPNVRFITGFIEALAVAGIEKNSVDICISNCVINLSPDKKKVLEGVFEALVEGGEIYFADVYANARLPESVRMHPVLFGECIGGALYTEDFLNITKNIGFAPPLQLQSSAVNINDPELLSLVGDTTFRSITYRLFKLPPSSTMSSSNGYQYTVTYNGGIVGHETDYPLDQDHVFTINKSINVDSHIADILHGSWLREYFMISEQS